MRRVVRLLTTKANEIIFTAEVLVLIAVLTVYGCLGQAADPFGDPVLGPHTAADTALLLGAIHSEWPRQQQAILAGANPNITDKSGDPFLNWHLRTDQDVDHLRFLVQHGANVNVRDAKFGITPLMLATMPATISYLVSVAALEAKDNEGLTPLFHALKQWSFLSSGLSESIVNSDVTTLLGRGANPNAVDQQGENALFYFLRMGHEYSKSCIGCRTVDPSTIIRALAQAGVNLNGTAQITGYAAPVSVLGYSGIYYPDATMFRAVLVAGTRPDELGNFAFFQNIRQACAGCASYAMQSYPSIFVSKSLPVSQSAPSGGSPPGDKPEWQKHLDWCINNHDAGGSVDCPADYMVSYPGCVVSGGRSCLMSIAKTSARDHDCDNAMKLALLCQCHSEEATNAIEAAGRDQVCQYLGPPDPPRYNPPPPPKKPPLATVPPTVDYYVIWQYACQYADGSSGGDCTITQHGTKSCQDSQQQIAQRAARTDVCKQCANVTDNSKHVVGQPQHVTGGGPCVGQ